MHFTHVVNDVSTASMLAAAQDAAFDAVVDKATLDSLMNCDDWHEQVTNMLKEALRVLKHGGK